MNTNSPNHLATDDEVAGYRKIRLLIRAGALLVCLVCIGAVIVHSMRHRPGQRDPRPSATQATESKPAMVVNPGDRAHSSSHAAFGRPAAPRQFNFEMQPTDATRKTVDGLVYLNPNGGALTAEQADIWKVNLQKLIQEGDTAVPAIREFLQKNTDVVFGPDATGTLGYGSARMAMIDVLAQIGTPLAEMAMDEVLQNTADPREIAQLAQNLQKLNPGVYQQDALDAVRQTLAMSMDGNLPGVDVAPLFQVMQKYGGPDAVADLEANAGQWSYYTTIALSQLPDGEGVPSLIQMATTQSGGGPGERTAALEMLTQLASQSKDAADTLLSQAQEGRLSSYDWATLEPFLAGSRMVFQNSAFGDRLNGINPGDLRKTMISSGNQSFYTAPLGALTAAQVNQQQAFLDKMLSVTSDPAGIQALQQAKALLQNRLVLLANNLSAP